MPRAGGGVAGGVAVRVSGSGRLARGLLAREDACNGLVQAIRLGPFRAVSVPEGREALLPAMADVERERVVLRVGAACGEAWYEGEVPGLG